MFFLKSILGFLLCLMTANAALASYDDIQDMKDKVIISAGTYTPVRCPIGGKYNCMLWPSGLVKSEDYRENLCFDIVSAIASCSTSCNGVVAVGKDKVPYFFNFNTVIGGTGIRKSPIAIRACPNPF